MKSLKKLLSEIRKLMFFGKTEGEIVAKSVYIDCMSGNVYEGLNKIVLRKTFTFYGKEFHKTKLIVKNAMDMEKFRVGDYYCDLD